MHFLTYGAIVLMLLKLTQIDQYQCDPYDYLPVGLFGGVCLCGYVCSLSVSNCVLMSPTLLFVQCSHSKRCASLARYGYVQEMAVLLKQALQNTGLELTSNERKVLADMLLHCYVHVVAQQSLNMPQTTTAFR